MIHYHIEVCGVVQGVGFRKSTQSVARKLGLVGQVKNTTTGSVEIEAVGPLEKLDKLVCWCHKGTPTSEVKRVAVTTGKLVSYSAFEII